MFGHAHALMKSQFDGKKRLHIWNSYPSNRSKQIVE